MDNSIGSFSLTPGMKHLTSEGGSNASGDSDSPPTAQLMDSFSETFQEKIGQVESLQQNAQTKMKKFAAGEIDDVHDVSVSLQKANMGLNVATAVRSKVLQGIQELQQMG